ncbi:hypothetical protein [Marivirga harenae]|uniref:hypothetical protein n=1 Tax=Marivirga harenae TaxID=2010992 RepID=UPI0026DFDDB8|nr:hypothetical protein [Marivirga harenae]WKV12338.1 hypothetical protein Q3Y49_00605 [Marivirga harenae]
MSNNVFNLKRFLMLAKQHYIQNNKLLFYAIIAYVGVIFILLTVVQMGNDREPHGLESFQGFLIGFIAVFGILYTGYSFPAFRSKESTINYLMLPSSVLEKFLFELLTRLSIVLILLPLLFWITFHLQGYFFNLFTPLPFESISFGPVLDFELPDTVKEYYIWFVILVGSLVTLGFVLPFTGGAMFSKQPLVKTLFAVALIVIFYAGCLFIIIEPMGLKNYQPNDSMFLIPHSEGGAIKFFGSLALFSNLVMLFIAYRKLKEREV